MADKKSNSKKSLETAPKRKIKKKSAAKKHPPKNILQFETLISGFSASLTRTHEENLENELNRWLERFVNFLKVDRCIVNEFMEDGKTVHCLLNYTLPGVDTLPVLDSYRPPDGVIKTISNGILIKAEKIPEDLPVNFRGGVIEQTKTKSIIIAPLAAGDNVIGSLLLACYRKRRRWSNDIIRRIKLITEIIANAILRIRSHKSLVLEMERRKILEEKYSTILKNANVGFFLADYETNILFVNDEYCRMSGYSRAELYSKRISDLQVRMSPDETKRVADELATTGAAHHEATHIKKGGGLIDLDVSSTVLDENSYCSFMRDITELNRTRRGLVRRLELEELTSEFSAALINSKLDDLIEELEKWIIRFVDFFGIDRGVVNEYNYEKNTIEAIVNYTDPAAAAETLPHDSELRTPDIVMNELKKGTMLRAEKIPEDLPESIKSWIIEKHNTKSLVVVPLISESQIIGNLTFAGYRKERKWPDDVFSRIKLIGEIIANAILRLRAFKALNKAQKELEERLEFEKVVSELSTALINIKPDDIECELGKWFEKFTELVDVDRCAVNEYGEDLKTVRNVMQYTAPGIDVSIPDIRETLEGEINELEKGTIKAEKIPEDLPQMFRGDPVERSNIKSFIIVPFFTGNRIFGNMAFSSFSKERKWTDELIRRIQLIAEIVGNAILRLRSHEALIDEMERRHMLEDRYSSIIETANVGFMISDMNANILEVNDAYREMIGYSRNELLGMKIYQLDISGDPEKVDKEKDDIFETGSFHHETKHIRKDGKAINVLVSANLLEKEEMVCCFIRDVTDIRIAKKELEERLEFEEVISEFSTTLINIQPDDVKDELGKWIKKIVDFFGADRCAINEYGDDQKTVNNLIQYSVSEVGIPPVPDVRKTPDGEIDELERGIIRAETIPKDLPQMLRGSFIEKSRAKSLILVPLLTGNRVFGNLAFANYRKERKWSEELIRRIKLIAEIVGNAILRLRAHEALIEEMKRRHMLEERYSSIIKTANEGFMISDLHANIVEVNDAYCEMTGYSRDELAGMKLNRLDISVDPDDVEKKKDKIFEAGELLKETNIIRKDGKVLNVLISASLLENEGVICSFVRDITELKIAREDLEERLEFEALSSEFSAALINLKLEDIDEELYPWMKKFVAAFGVERGILNEYLWDENRINVIAVYTDPDIDVPPTDKSVQVPKLMMEHLAKGNVVRVEKIPRDLTTIFNEDVIRRHGTKSIAVVPLLAEKQIIGNLAFLTYTEEHEWPDELVRRIRLIGEIIANAILRKRSSDALIEEIKSRHMLEEKYTSIIKNASVGFTISDYNQNILDVNDEYCRMSGYTRDELLKMKISDIDFSGSDEKVDDDIALTLDDGIFHHQSKHVRKDGSTFDVDIHSQHSKREGFFFSFVRDVTELNKARKELVDRLKFEELTSEFSAALVNVRIEKDRTSLDIWLKRLSEFLNLERCAIGEYSEDYSTYRFVCKYTKPMIGAELPSIPEILNNDGSYGLERHLMKGEAITLEKPSDRLPEDLTKWKNEILADGTKSILMLPLISGDTLLGSVTFGTLTHEQKWSRDLVRRLRLVAEIYANTLMRDRADQQLKKYQDHLERMVEERTARLEIAQKELVKSERMATLGKLTATVSHELRNPLGTIKSSVYYVQKRLENRDKKIVRAIERAERSIDRCDLIIGELLNYSRMRDLILEPTQIDDFMNEVLEEIEPPTGILIKKEFGSNEIIKMDRERFIQCVVNILTNAYQSIQEKGDDEPGYVTIVSRKGNEHLIVEISDNGKGFDMADKDKIFEPLYSTKTFGVGLGVPIIKQIIEQHGWHMDITGAPQKGATVSITIPL